MEKDKKSVKFNLNNNKVSYIIAWDFAYRMARKGNWEQIARDTERFQRRIKCLEPILIKVINIKHRDKVYNNVIMDNNNTNNN